ncbi:MAG TPA: ribonucleotide reductase N-terminal alpha domain-containing protein, partial [Methanosarcina sp.]|nr:ribonucleotide reductase N-terminal alpha domain-containing protein [Methanosarcina sp.]
MTLKVTKRDGTQQDLDLEKIHGHTEYATRGVEGVSQAELESDSCMQFYDGMPTTQIQKTLELTAADKICLESPGWSKVAMRLALQDLFKEVTGDSFKYPTIRSYLKKGVKIGVLDKRLMKDFDLEAIDKAIQPERDELFEYLGLTTLSDRYFIRDKKGQLGRKNRCLELPQHFFMRVAMGLALAEKPEERTKWAIEFYDVLSNLEYMSSTPTLFNAGTNFAQLSSCFLLSMGDSLKGIFASLEEAASYSKFAGGIGIDLGHIRAQGSYIKSTQGIAGGAIPYAKLVNDILLGFDQGG